MAAFLAYSIIGLVSLAIIVPFFICAYLGFQFVKGIVLWSTRR